MLTTQVTVQKPQSPLQPASLAAQILIPALVIHSPSDQSLIPLIGKRSWIIGRNLKSDIVIRDRYISRQHAQLQLIDTGEYKFADLGSGNGSLLNDLPVTRPVCLNDGDRLTLGHIELEFHCPKVALKKVSIPSISKRVLIVQSQRQGNFWRDALMARGITLTCPRQDVDLMQYLKKLRSKPEWPDLLLLDMTALQPDPFSFCRWCRSTYPLLKVILTSGHRTEVAPSERKWVKHQGAVELLSAFPEQRLLTNMFEQTTKVSIVLKALKWQPRKLNDHDEQLNSKTTILAKEN